MDAYTEAQHAIRNVKRDWQQVADYLVNRCGDFTFDEERAAFIGAFLKAAAASEGDALSRSAVWARPALSDPLAGMAERLETHVGCGDVDNRGACPQCEAIRKILRGSAPSAVGEGQNLPVSTTAGTEFEGREGKPALGANHTGSLSATSDGCDTGNLVTRITAAVREADRTFERVGGSSRHWVRDCFLPTLEKHGLAVWEGTRRAIVEEVLRSINEVAEVSTHWMNAYPSREEVRQWRDKLATALRPSGSPGQALPPPPEDQPA
jgi:hypothetical protein